jgi:hypothetical protein
MSTLRHLVLALLGGCLIGGCATLPVPKLQQADSSGIGISLRIRAPIKWFSREPDTVYFVKTDADGGLRQIQLIRSNYAKEGRVYFLNLPPGSYAAVAAVFSQTQGPSPVPVGPPPPGISVNVVVGGGRTGYTTYFPKELIEQTLVTVRKGELVFMGHYVIDQSPGLSEADPIQLHFAEVIAPGATKSGIGHFFSSDYHYRGSIHEARHDDETRSEFLARAREDLAAGGWAGLIR